MTESLSIWTLMSEATLLVQAVMLILVLASVVSWVMIVQRFQLITAARQELDAFEEDFWSGTDLREIYREVAEREDGAVVPGAEQILWRVSSFPALGVPPRTRRMCYRGSAGHARGP